MEIYAYAVEIFADTFHGDYQVTIDSSFVALGNATYGKELAEMLWLGDKYQNFDLEDDYIDTLSSIFDLNPSNIETSELYAAELDRIGNDEEAIYVSKEILRRSETNQTALRILAKHFDFYKIYLSDKEQTVADEKKEAPQSLF